MQPTPALAGATRRPVGATPRSVWSGRLGRGFRTAIAGLLAVPAALALSGCSDPEASDYLPAEVGKLTVERPVAWGVEFPVDAPWTTGFRAAPDSVEQIQLSGEFGEFVTAAQGMGSLIGQAQIGLQGFTVVQTRDVEVKGATTAQAVQYTITDNTGSQLSGEWIVAAHWPYPQSVAVSVLNRQFDPDLERRLVDTMELHPVLK